jgi:uncharacterized repeat protein (TIGR01451 family)
VQFDNDASTLAQAGSLKFHSGDGPDASTGTFDVAAAMEFANGTYDLGAASTVSGAGTVVFSGGVTNLNGSYDLAATSIVGGQAVFQSLSPTTEVLNQSAGILQGSGQLTIDGQTAPSSWTGGTMQNAGTTMVAEGSTLNIAGASVKDIHTSRVLRNEGTIAFGGTGNIRTGTGAVFDNAGLWDAQTDADLNQDFGGTAAFQNSGILRKSAGAGGALSSDVNPTVTNTGRIEALAGVLNLPGGFTNYNQTTDILAGGTYQVRATLRFQGADIKTNDATVILDTPAAVILDQTVNDGLRNFAVNGPEGDFTVKDRTLAALSAPNLTNQGILRGNGTYAKNVTSSGTVEPGLSPGLLTIDGNYTQAAGGTLAIEVGGLGAGEFDRLNVTGTAMLAGELEAVPLTGFVPVTGVGIDVVTAAQRAGEFDTVTSSPALAGSLVPEARYDATTAKLFSVPGGGAADDSAAEAIGTKTLTVTLSAPSSEQVTVNYETANGTAEAGTDYSAVSGTLTFVADDTTETFDVPITNDTRDEPDQTFLVNLSSPNNTVLTDTQATVTIADDDDAPTIAIGDVMKAEGTGAGTTAFDFEVTLSTPSENTVTAQFATADGSAITPADYLESTGVVTFAPGDTTETVTVQVVRDAIIENHKQFFVNLTNPGNSTIADAQAQGTIQDDDQGGAAPQLSIADVEEPILETDGDTASATFTVTLTPAAQTPVTVLATAVGGSALADTDFEPTAELLTFAPDDTVETVTVPIRGDNRDESTETFGVVLSGQLGATLSDGFASASIADDDATPELVTEANLPATEDELSEPFTLAAQDQDEDELSFEVVRGPAHGELTGPGDGDEVQFEPDPNFNGFDSFEVEVTDGTNASRGTYAIEVAPANDVPVAEDQTVVTVQGRAASFRLRASDVESDELLFAVTGAPQHGTVEIEGDDAHYTPTPGFTGTDTFQFVADDDQDASTPATVTVDVLAAGGVPSVTLADQPGAPETADEVVFNLASPAAAVIRLSTSDGTGKADEDYIPASGTFTFAGAGSRDFPVKLIDDGLDEDDETFRVNVEVLTGGVTAPSFATGTIADDDALVELAGSAVNTPEGDSGSHTVQVPVTLSKQSGRQVLVAFATANGSATAGLDYLPAAGPLAFAPGETSKSLTVTILGDTEVELDETLTIELTSPLNAAVIGGGSITILKDDSTTPPPPPPPPPPALPTADLAVTMGGPASSAVDRAVTYDVSVHNNGPDTATGVVVTDALPAGLQIVSARVGQVACATSPVVRCTVGTLVSGGTAALTIVATTLEPGIHTNTATVAGNEADPAAGNNAASATTRVPVPVTRDPQQQRQDGCTQRGTAGDDVLRGTPGVDVLCGLGGNDVLVGFGGNDRLLGGAGNDRLLGGAGKDSLKGGNGRDELLGGAGADRLDGGRGRDTLAGEGGNDHLNGSYGNDFLIGGKGKDRVLGGPGKDRMRRDGQDAALGGPGADQCLNTGIVSRCP